MSGKVSRHAVWGRVEEGLFRTFYCVVSPFTSRCGKEAFTLEPFEASD